MVVWSKVVDALAKMAVRCKAPELRYVRVRPTCIPGRRLPLEKLGGGVLPTSQNSYPIYDQNLLFLLAYL